eukprot:SAG22_NODE_13353_length_409_cov_1.638710_1_plen_23_part_01
MKAPRRHTVPLDAAAGRRLLQAQ